jgi:hypothetical protein
VLDFNLLSFISQVLELKIINMDIINVIESGWYFSWNKGDSTHFIFKKENDNV